jgi:hypothetical protein
MVKGKVLSARLIDCSSEQAHELLVQQHVRLQYVALCWVYMYTIAEC